MPTKSGSNLSRFKKGEQGLREFASLIEQADTARRDMIIKAMEEEDPDFLFTAMRKIVFFDELVYLEDTILAEILSKISSKVLAHSLNGIPEDFRSKFLGQLGYREKKLVIEEGERLENAADSFRIGAQKQILKVARDLEKQGKISFELSSCPRFEEMKKKKTAA